MAREIVVIGGSPSGRSRSGFVAKEIGDGLAREGWAVRTFGIGDFAAEDVFWGRAEAPAIAKYLEAVKGAAGIVLATPVYKATYTGALKAIVDLIPQDALIGKAALGIATARQEAHGREADRAYQSLFAFFRARAVGSLVVLDEELRLEAEAGTFTDPARARVAEASKAFRAALDASDPAR